MIRSLSVVCLLLCAPVAYAMGNDNGPEFGGATTVDCRSLAESGDAEAAAICANLSVHVQRQVCDPTAVCQQYAELVCGDIEDVCNSDDTLFAIAKGIGQAKAACFLAHETSQSTEVSCGDAALTCGDLTTGDVNQTCPPINVTVDEADVDCAKCVKRVTYFKDGSVRSERERCFNCSVHGSLELN